MYPIKLCRYDWSENKLDQFKMLLDAAIAECMHEIKLRKTGIPGEATLLQLNEVVLPELLSLKRKEREDLPAKKDRWLTSFGEAFFEWGWDMHHPTRLYLLLLELDTAYKQL